ncbi:MAG: 4-hydroxy-tetrahydrodipicolinate synthase [Spirochaetales bacterium]|nr:4-hydroxy-tetrahydrodipicolinate synthase [Spirochaetales bacterium]
MSLRGVFTALVTPFNKDRSVDEAALRNLVDLQVKGGVSGLVPMGTTGESPTLDHEEHIRVIEVVVDQANGKLPIIAGTGSNSTQEAIEMTKYAAEIGVAASLQVAPYYNKPTQDGFFKHFAAIAEAVDIPLIIYNIPSRTAKNIENETMLRLAEIPSIKGVKESSGDMIQVMDLILRRPDGFVVLSGDDNIGLAMMAMGGDGIVSVASNIVPEQMSEMVSTALDNEIEKARAIHYQLLPLFQGLFIETNPIPIKASLALQDKIGEVYRLPMCAMADENKKILKKVLKDLQLL